MSRRQSQACRNRASRKVIANACKLLRAHRHRGTTNITETAVELDGYIIHSLVDSINVIAETHRVECIRVAHVAFTVWCTPARLNLSHSQLYTAEPDRFNGKIMMRLDTHHTYSA